MMMMMMLMCESFLTLSVQLVKCTASLNGAGLPGGLFWSPPGSSESGLELHECWSSMKPGSRFPQAALWPHQTKRPDHARRHWPWWSTRWGGRLDHCDLDVLSSLRSLLRPPVCLLFSSGRLCADLLCRAGEMIKRAKVCRWTSLENDLRLERNGNAIDRTILFSLFDYICWMFTWQTPLSPVHIITTWTGAPVSLSKFWGQNVPAACLYISTTATNPHSRKLAFLHPLYFPAEVNVALRPLTVNVSRALLN